jgi:hypothetical protein
LKALILFSFRRLNHIIHPKTWSIIHSPYSYYH